MRNNDAKCHPLTGLIREFVERAKDIVPDDPDGVLTKMTLSVAGFGQIMHELTFHDPGVTMWTPRIELDGILIQKSEREKQGEAK